MIEVGRNQEYITLYEVHPDKEITILGRQCLLRPHGGGGRVNGGRYRDTGWGWYVLLHDKYETALIYDTRAQAAQAVYEGGREVVAVTDLNMHEYTPKRWPWD